MWCIMILIYPNSKMPAGPSLNFDPLIYRSNEQFLIKFSINKNVEGKERFTFKYIYTRINATFLFMVLTKNFSLISLEL